MIFGAESDLGRAALIGKQLLAAQELLIDLGVIKSKATKAIATANLDAASSGSAVSTVFAQTLKLGFPAAIPALIGYAASAFGIISSVLAATKKTKSYSYLNLNRKTEQKMVQGNLKDKKQVHS